MQSSQEASRFNVRHLFVKGMLFALPVAVTILAVRFAVNLADSYLGPATAAIVGRNIPGLSLVFICLVLICLGALASWGPGRKLLALLERLIMLAPGVSVIYSALRKIVNIFETGQSRNHQRVVMVDINPNGRVPAFVVDSVVDKNTGAKNLVVCIPSKPNPTGATVMIVPEDTTCDAGMTPDQVLSWGMSLGMNTPAELPISPPGPPTDT